MLSKNQHLAIINNQIAKCSACQLAYTRNRVVVGEGNAESSLMIIGEAPGATEDKKGIPFCGKSGEFLNTVLEENNLNRDKVFITNIVKCRPPRNEYPSDESIKACLSNFVLQRKCIKPTMFICLGNLAFRTLAGNNDLLISRNRGTLIRVGQYIIAPLWHPAYVVRYEHERETFRQDFKRAIDYYATYINNTHNLIL